MLSFESLKIDSRLKKNLVDLSFTSMTPVQEKSLPIVISGEDVIVQAKTGSGKTVAFGLGILNRIETKQMSPQALILCPTRELVEQVATELRALARTIPNTKILTITGGKSEYQQMRSLEHGAQVVVGTTGRVLKHLRKKNLDLIDVKQLVLDEADRMLDMGFIDDIHKISSYVPRERQTLLFSATFPQDIEELSSKIQNQAQRISVDVTHSENNIEQEFILLESHKEKNNALLKVLGAYQAERFIVFCKTKRISDVVADKLYAKGIAVEAIHGDLEQDDRTEILTMFSNRSLSGIVATDVAARGIDIKDLDLVVNFDLPNDPEVYVHRVGRTGRAGKSGRAVSFLVSQEEDIAKKICEYQNKDFVSKNLDSFDNDQAYEVKPEMTTLLIRGGKRDKLRPGDIVGAIVGESGIDFQEIGDISVQNIVTYVAISSTKVDFVCEKLKDGKIKNKKFKMRILK